MARRIILLLFTALAVLLNSYAYGAKAERAAPNCKLTPIGGDLAQELRQYRGKVLYVDFWASWCGPCAESFPFMNSLHRDLQDRGLQIVGINLDEKPEDAKAFLAKHPANFAVMADASGQCPQDFGVQAMPSTYLIDRQGVIRHIHPGFRPGEAEQLRTLVEQMLAEPPARQ